MNDLLEALEDLPKEVLARIASTVAGDDAIAVGSWYRYALDCGCLVTNGYVASGADTGVLYGTYTEPVPLKALARFYDMDPSRVSCLSRVAEAFDAWCVERETRTILYSDSPAREELREVLREAVGA